jgi:hypothetical protein
VVQDTGWSAHLPSGEGLLPFSTAEEAVDALDAVEGDYDRHARRAREIAGDCFDGSHVLPALLDAAGL